MTNILVIDDNILITTMLEKELTSDNCRVRVAHSGQAGLKLLVEQTFDVVITDIIMPESDGLEVIMAIKEMQPCPKVIAMTGGTQFLSREYLSEMARALRVQHVLFKPFSIDELMEVVFEG